MRTMMKKFKKKLHSKAGESLVETLVSLLIAAIALTMLAGTLNAASNIITKSRRTLDTYYSANEDETGVTGVIKMTGSGNTGSVTMTMSGTNTSENISLSGVPIVYYKNETFSKTPVIAYKSVAEVSGSTASGG